MPAGRPRPARPGAAGLGQLQLDLDAVLMVRNYVPTKPGGGRYDPSMRRGRVAELRAAGLSLRKIAARLHVSEGTVRNDLKAIEAAARECVIPLRRSAPERGEVTRPDYAPDATVTPIRRSS